jgi:A/G-specific adenine glycosylase
MVIADQHAGVVPSDERALRALPGVGPYTARAVRSFAFELDGALVDTNVIRVLTRCVEGRGLTVPEAQRLADRLVPPSESWAFNQTMFDLGATVCIGTAPHCGRCPLQRQCRWHQSGWAEPDPWRASPSVRVQSRFAGSDRQGRGRLLDRLRSGTVAPAELAASCGWPDDQSRAQRIAAALVTEGFAVWAKGHDGREALQLR